MFDPFSATPSLPADSASSQQAYMMPLESDRHEWTWMQWPAHADIYDNATYLDLVGSDLARLASTIAQFEPVIMLARPTQAEAAQRRCGSMVQVLAMAVDDMWARDSSPIFVRSASGALAALDLHFNGWGGKQRCAADARVAQCVAEWLDVPLIDAGFVGEGGGIESDGAGTVLTTESCLLNRNRNPDLGREDIERLLATGMGARRIVWVPGVEGIDITDDHIDGFARFVRPGVVLLEHPDPADDPRWAGHGCRCNEAIAG
jgi:agmatine deiminase